MLQLVEFDELEHWLLVQMKWRLGFSEQLKVESFSKTKCYEIIICLIFFHNFNATHKDMC
jgi:hypothetical protein